MTILKWLGILVVIGIILAALVPIVVTHIEKNQAQNQEALIKKFTQPAGGEKRAAVIYFSRSNSTALLAHHIGQQQSARLFRLVAPDYRLGLLGWINAMLDARKPVALITPEQIDLASYNPIYLGSPIWLYSPAPPIWQFVDNNRFDGKDVVLFNTFNSQFKQQYIDEFRSKVMRNGARSFKHRYVRRGRMGQQLSPEEMLKAFDATSITEGK